MSATEKKFKVDVDALFGEQAARESEANVSMRRGTRLHARKASLTHGRSFANLMSNHAGMNTDQVANFEMQEMRKAETEQRQTDNFWGFDKESIDVMMEISNMILADEYSQAHELYCKTTGQQEAWRKEEEIKLANERHASILSEESAHNMYLKAFYSAEISGDIMKFKWPTRPEIKPDDELIAADLAVSNREAKAKTRTAGDYQIWTLECEPSTIHLDGLQQSRTISMNGETYDPRKTASIADLAMRPAGTRKSRGPGGTLAGGGSSGGSCRPISNGQGATSEPQSPGPQTNSHSERKPTSHRPSTAPALSTSAEFLSRCAKDANKMLLNEVTPRHRDALDGHPLYKWNAREMLRVAFTLLDTDKSGHLTRQAMVNIANNADNWMAAAQAVSYEENVSVMHIRLESEHKKIVSSGGVWAAGDGRCSAELAASFAMDARQFLHAPERCAGVCRQLLAGDFVWGLYSKGCVWLPAKITSVNADGSYNLTYLSSSDSVREAQLATSNRQFLPRHVDKKSEIVPVKPFATEQAVCGYVFDLIGQADVVAESERIGNVIDCNFIASQLKLKRYEDVVRTSAALSVVVCEKYRLLEVMVDAFAEFGNRCSKAEFIEFCSEALDMVTFSRTGCGLNADIPAISRQLDVNTTLPPSLPPTYSPARGMPTPRPQHTFDTLMPTQQPSLRNPDDQSNGTKSKNDNASKENFDILISLSVLGGLIVLVCTAILIYWHFFTRVAAPNYSKTSDEGGISFTNFFGSR